MSLLARQVFGLPVPDEGALFDVALACHIAAGMTCVVTGALAATAPKRPGRHTTAGRIFSGPGSRPSARTSAAPERARMPYGTTKSNSSVPALCPTTMTTGLSRPKRAWYGAIAPAGSAAKATVAKDQMTAAAAMQRTR